ncbi:hypothetical protein QR680_005568 [Steinernema hermaphroditum]|uniref:Nose resistant-to-fluoxetine protein N-terminal domain-containing protein n=1 Tax=Steinernema hermaphroditum TaxID=289476 RepID=A0AA39HSH9_9BILA|nr:hypothetical protein QR680_005568 [Steinernema hermaphroditum]
MSPSRSQLGFLLLLAFLLPFTAALNGHLLLSSVGRRSDLMESTEVSLSVDQVEAMSLHSVVKRLRNADLTARNLSLECMEDMLLFVTTVYDTVQDRASPLEKEFLLNGALKMFDASGKVSSGLLTGRRVFYGMLYECTGISQAVAGRERPFEGAYVRFLLSRSLGHWKSPDACPGALKELGWDACVPKSCENKKDLAEISSFLEVPKEGSPICSVITMEDHRYHPNVGTWIVVGFMVLVGLLGIAASFYDFFVAARKDDPVMQRTDVRFFRAFSLYTNISEICNVGGAKKEGQISPIHCIRFFSICWVMIGHSLMLVYFFCASNPLEAMEIMKDVPAQILTNAYFAVDSFFFMSGLLLAYMWFKALKTNRRRTMSLSGWLLFYTHRILRLSPPYYVTIVFYTFVFRTWIHDMPTYMTPPIDDPCSKNYWINLLYLTNLVDYKDQCYLISWYLATDLQVFLFTPLILIPFAFKPLLGYVVAGLFLAASTVANAICVFLFYFPPSDFSFGKQDPRMRDFSLYTFLMYDAPWIRCQVYIMGMVLGYYLQVNPKRRAPKINHLVNIFCWICAAGLMLAAVLVLYTWTNGTEWTLAQRAAYSALSKPAWGLGLCWIVYACFYGYGGPINSFMSWEIWVPLGRLSYSAYLIHMMVAVYLPGMKQGDIYYSTFPDAFVSFLLPIISVTFFFALFWSAAFEVSFAKVEAILISSLMNRSRSIGKRRSERESPDSSPPGTKVAVSMPTEDLPKDVRF